MSELAEIKNLLEKIDGRLQRVEDIEDIRRLIVDYARGADHGNDPEKLTPLFTEDAVWEAKGFGRWEGRDKAIAFLKAIAGEKVWWSLHFMISPKIDLEADGQSATLLWYLWEPATMPDEDTKQAEPHWITGIYDAEVVKVSGQWLFKTDHQRYEYDQPGKRRLGKNPLSAWFQEHALPHVPGRRRLLLVCLWKI